MISLRTVGTEVSALGTVVLSVPLRAIWRCEPFDTAAPHPTPVVLVHGLLGDPSNFFGLCRHLAGRGVRNVGAFSYLPRIDYQRLAHRLGVMIEDVCAASGARQVDVVGHSLGGLVSRYLVETDDGGRVRRLVTLGTPYFATPVPPNELAIIGDSDPFVPAPHPTHTPRTARLRPAGRLLVVPHCGHWGVLYHPTVLGAVADFLCAPSASGETPEPLVFEAAG